MTTKLTLWMALGVLCLACCFSGCQSSKIAYGNSHYFKQTPKPVAEAQPVAETQSELVASLDKKTVANQTAARRMVEAREQLAAVAADPSNPTLQASVARTKELVGEMKDEQLNRKEKRAKRKELRQELRTLRKEFKNAAPDATNDMHRYLRLSLILWGAALVLSIVAAATIAPIIGVLAGLVGLAGSVFFVLWLIDEFG